MTISEDIKTGNIEPQTFGDRLLKLVKSFGTKLAMIFIMVLFLSFVKPVDAPCSRYPYDRFQVSPVFAPWVLPTATTNAATSVTATTATLNGSGNPHGNSTTGWFRYSPTNPGTADDAFGTRAPAFGGADLGPGVSEVPYLQAITGLSPATVYYFCAITENANGIAFGSIQTFTTGPIVYSFTGSGNWDNPSNWTGMQIPPAVLPSNAQIVINPAGSSECVLNISQTISAGANLTVMANKKFRIPGNLDIQ